MIMTWLLVNVFLAAMLSVMGACYLLRWRMLGPEDRLRERLFGVSRSQSPDSSDTPLLLRKNQLSTIPFLHRVMQKLHVARNLQDIIEQADMSMTAGGLLLTMLIFGEVALILSLKLSRPLISVVAFIVFASFPLLHVLKRRKKRIRQFSEQFPDAIDMMTSALKAGHALGRAMQLVAMEAPEPIRTEFRKTFEEQNLGLPIKDALLNLARRIDNVDLKLFVTAVIIQRESGGNLTEILAKISQTIRARFVLLGQIQVYTAQGRFTSWILGLLPAAIGFIIYMVSPEYIMFHFQDPVGRIIFGLAVFLQILGFFTIRKIVRMKVQ
jgi:tight adherence protein B